VINCDAEKPEIEIVYASNSLKAWVNFKCANTYEVKQLRPHNLSRTNVYNSIHSRVPCDYATKLSAVEAEAEAAFTPIGALIESEKAQGAVL
jgi:hypothetical protein